MGRHLEGRGRTREAYSTPASAVCEWQVPTSSNHSGFLYTPREIESSGRLSF
jgi:hypothetical protein